MKKIGVGLLLVLLVLFGLAPMGHAQDTDDAKLQETATMVDQEADQPEGKKEVVGRLEKEFNVTEDQVNDLRGKGLGYGEISITYSLAQKMPGGLTDANVQKVLELRQDKKMGWGNVARELNLKLGEVVGKAKRIERPEKIQKSEKPEKPQKLEKPERHERPDKFERPERPSRPERPEKPHRK